MKLLILSHRVPFPPNKGEKIRTFHQLCFLRSLGYDITLATLEHEASDAEALRVLSDQYGIRSVSARLGPVWLRYARSLMQRQPLSVGHFHSARLHARVRELMAEGQFDAVLCTGSSMAGYVNRLQSAPKPGQLAPRLLMDFMDLDSDKWRQYCESRSFPLSWVYGRESRLLANHEHAIQKQFDVCFFISAKEAEMFGESLGITDPAQLARTVRVVPNGVDTTTFSPREQRSPAKPAELLFTGVMDYYPNVDAMVHFAETAWPAITAALPGTRLTIAGMNPQPEIQALGELPGVEVTGFVDDIVPFYHRADVFVGPFRIARGVQNKTLQALAVGLPVVTTPIGAEGIDAAHGTHLLIAESGEPFAREVINLLSDSALYRGLCDNGIDLINERYGWDACNAPLARSLAA